MTQTPAPPFDVVLRGYDRAQVDAWIEAATAGRASTPQFKAALRGYDRRQVDQYVERVLGR